MDHAYKKVWGMNTLEFKMIKLQNKNVCVGQHTFDRMGDTKMMMKLSEVSSIKFCNVE